MTVVSFLPYPMDVHTPRGPGKAWVRTDYGPDHHLVWDVIMKDTGESWSFANPDVRFAWCETNKTGRRPEMPAPWPEANKQAHPWGLDSLPRSLYPDQTRNYGIQAEAQQQQGWQTSQQGLVRGSE
jgi:hypothetical protein